MELEQRLRAALTPRSFGSAACERVLARLAGASHPPRSKGRTLILSCVIGGLVCAAAAATLLIKGVWFNGRNSAVVAEIATSKAQYQTPLAVPEVPEPLAVPEVPEKPALPIPNADTNPRAFRPATAEDGSYDIVRSIDLSNYLVLVGIGTLNNAPVLLNPDGTLAEARVAEEMQARAIGRLQEQYGLTDQELEKLLDVTRSALESDKQNQSAETAQVCAARATFRNIEDFGAAVNDSRRRIELHQENLGREATEKLGSALFSKFEARNQRFRTGRGTDFTIMLVAQHRDLETEIKRICDGPGH